MATDLLLKVEGLRCGYGEAVVLDGVSFELGAGRSLALLGRNGTGKTTLIDTLVGVTTRHAGRIALAGRTIEGLPVYARAAAGIGWVPQERNIFKSLTVDENLSAVARPREVAIRSVREDLRGMHGTARSAYGLSRDRPRARRRGAL